MLFPKMVILAAILVPAIALSWLQHLAAVRQQENNARLRISIATIERHIDAIENASLGIRPVPSNVKVMAPPTLSHASNAPASSLSGAPAASGETPCVTLSKAHLNRLELAPLTSDFKLTDEVCAVLGLSASERATLDQAIARLVATQQQMDISRITMISDHLTAEEGRKTTFKVPAYPEEGRKLAEALLSETQGTIGAERTELLLGYSDLNSLSAEGYEPFGRTEKTITFLDRVNADGTRGDCKIYMKVIDTVSGFSLSTSFDNRNDSIPKPWRHLVQNIAPTP